MELGLFAGHASFLWRFLHVFFGIIWIGHLYYFNFVQTPFFGETDANTKTGVVQKLVPRALWWFRWGAMGTFLTGLFLLVIGLWGNRDIPASIQLTSQWGSVILPGALMGTLMWYNVWHVIWPAQKIVIASTNAVATGGKADPRAADAGARAGVASRTNTLFSIPLLFSMLGTGHLTFATAIGEGANFTAYWTILFILIGVIEFNALWGKMIAPLKTVKNVVISGFVLTAVFYALMECLLRAPVS